VNQKEQNYARRLEILHKLDQAILAAEPFESIAQSALELMRQLVPFKRATIVLYDFATHEAIIIAAHIEGESTLGKQARRRLDMFRNVNQLRAGKIRYIEDISALSQPSPLEQLLLMQPAMAMTAPF